MGIRWGIDDLGLDIVMTCTGIEFFGLRIDDFNGDRHFRACPFRIFHRSIDCRICEGIGFFGLNPSGFVKGSNCSGWILQDLWRDRIVRVESFRICEGIELFGLCSSGFVKGSKFWVVFFRILWRDRTFRVEFFRICEGIEVFGCDFEGLRDRDWYFPLKGLKEWRIGTDSWRGIPVKGLKDWRIGTNTCRDRNRGLGSFKNGVAWIPIPVPIPNYNNNSYPAPLVLKFLEGRGGNK